MNTAELETLLKARPKGDRLMSAREIYTEAGFGETFFYERLVADPRWPAPIRIGRSTRWWRSEVLAFFEAKRVRRADEV